jgi:hypothetical protein
MFVGILVILKLGKVWGCVGWIPGFGDVAKSGGKLYKGAGKAAGRVTRRGFATAGEDRKAAKAMGWKKEYGVKSMREEVFTDGRYYYARDVGIHGQGGHKGGAWKRFPSKKSVLDNQRDATLDRILNIIGE